MGLYTWSEAERVEACPASAILPRVLGDNDDTARGHAGHAFLARRLSGMGRAAALALVADRRLRATCDAIRLQRATHVDRLASGRPHERYRRARNAR
jgi:hypothetical protein